MQQNVFSQKDFHGHNTLDDSSKPYENIMFSLMNTDVTVITEQSI